MKSKFLKKLFPVSLVVVVAVIGVTSATILHTLTLENPIKTPTVSGEVEEDASKHVSFTNTGEADVFLRAAYSETWLYTEDGGETTIILPNEAESKADSSKTIPVAVPLIDPDEMWVDGGDGWYYYKNILCGSVNGTAYKNTTNLIDGVTFYKDSVTDDRYAATATEENSGTYSEYQIHVVTEVVQASDEVDVSVEAVKELFDKDINDTLNEFDTTETSDGRTVINSGKYTSVIDWPKN